MSNVEQTLLECLYNIPGAIIVKNVDNNENSIRDIVPSREGVIYEDN